MLVVIGLLVGVISLAALNGGGPQARRRSQRSTESRFDCDPDGPTDHHCGADRYDRADADRYGTGTSSTRSRRALLPQEAGQRPAPAMQLPPLNTTAPVEQFVRTAPRSGRSVAAGLRRPRVARRRAARRASQTAGLAVSNDPTARKRKASMIRPRPLQIALGVGAGVALAGGGYAVAASTSSQIHACVSNKTRALTLEAKCPRGSRAVVWGVRGPGGSCGRQREERHQRHERDISLVEPHGECHPGGAICSGECVDQPGFRWPGHAQPEHSAGRHRCRGCEHRARTRMGRSGSDRRPRSWHLAPGPASRLSREARGALS